MNVNDCMKRLLDLVQELGFTISQPKTEGKEYSLKSPGVGTPSNWAIIWTSVDSNGIRKTGTDAIKFILTGPAITNRVLWELKILPRNFEQTSRRKFRAGFHQRAQLLISLRDSRVQCGKHGWSTHLLYHKDEERLIWRCSQHGCGFQKLLGLGLSADVIQKTKIEYVKQKMI